MLKNSLIVRLFIFTLLFVVTSASANIQPREIVLGVTKTTLESSHGQFSKKLYEILFKRLNYKLIIKVFPAIRLEERTKSENIDGELIRMSEYGKTRPYLTMVEEAHFDFSIAVYASDKTLKLNKWEGLSKLHSGYRRGVKVIENELSKRFDKKHFDSFDNLDQVVKLLNSKRLDTYIGIEYLTDDFLKKNNYKSIQKMGRLKTDTAHVFLGAKYGFLGKALSQELKRMKISGEYLELRK